MEICKFTDITQVISYIFFIFAMCNTVVLNVCSYYRSVESVDIENDLGRNSPIYTGHSTIVNPLGKKIETTEL